jgi:hypothetical protein
MKASVCFTPKSFDFNLNQETVALSLQASSVLIEKMGGGFVAFFKSSDFDSHAAIELFKQDAPLDAGAIMSLLYDQQMGKASVIELDENNVTQQTNTSPPVYRNTWLSLYSSDSNTVLTVNVDRTIHSESCLVNYCSDILVNNPRGHKEYADSFVDVFNNLIFLDNSAHKDYKTFDSIRKMDGGYGQFIKGITDSLSYMNNYSIIPNDSLKNVGVINASLSVPVTPEGTGKNKRTIKALKRDFFIDKVEYKNVNCEFHCKLDYIDSANGNGNRLYNRIYFGFFNRIDPNKPKIAIAHIGEHL